MLLLDGFVIVLIEIKIFGCFVRYAGLRRRLLVDPHISKDGSSSPDLVIDNPLSQNPGNHLALYLSLFKDLIVTMSLSSTPRISHKEPPWMTNRLCAIC